MTHWVEQPQISMPGSPEHADAAPAVWSLRLMLLLLLIVAAALVDRQVIWYVGFPVSLGTLAIVLGTLLPAVTLVTSYTASVTLPPRLMRHAFGLRVIFLVAWITCLLGLGILYDYQTPFAVLKEYFGALTLISLLLLGTHDEVWLLLRKPLVVLFYISLVLILLTYHTPAAVFTRGEFQAVKAGQVPRNLDTIGYSIRSVIDLGPFLFAWGMASVKKDLWRRLMMGGLPIYVLVESLIFEFRGSLLVAGVILATYVALTPVVRTRIPLKAIIGIVFASGIGFVVASQTRGFEELLRRFDQREGMFDSRITEAQAFFKDMGPVDLLIGRGLSGTYLGPDWAPMAEYKGRPFWSANHFGFLGFVLRGGVILLLLMASFAVPYFLPKPPGWYANEYNLAAIVSVPVLLLNILVNPLDFFTESVFLFLMWGFCFARLSTFGSESTWQPTMQPIDSES